MNEQSDNTRDKTLREAEKQIVRSAFLALAALAVIVFACYAWFASNRTVTGEIGSVRLSGSSFELASVGDVGAFDSIIGDRAGEGLEWDGPNSLKGTITGQRSDIRWKISSDDSHFENTPGADGIAPGKSGTLRFYVVPQKPGPGTLTLKFDTRLIPLLYDETQIIDNTLNNLLRGHILFTLETVNEESRNQLLNFPTTGNTAPGSFQLELSVDADCTPIPVCLKWQWPYESSDASTAVGDTILNENRACFFYNYGNLIEDDLSESLESFYYNNADQYIGENVSYLVFQLTAEEILSN